MRASVKIPSSQMIMHLISGAPHGRQVSYHTFDVKATMQQIANCILPTGQPEPVLCRVRERI